MYRGSVKRGIVETKGFRSRFRSLVFAALVCVHAALLMVLSAPVATAQSANFRSIDVNNDGVLSRSELIAAFGQAGAERLLRTHDHNGDGVISIRELRRGAISASESAPERDRDDPRSGPGNSRGDEDRDDDRDDKDHKDDRDDDKGDDDDDDKDDDAQSDDDD